ASRGRVRTIHTHPRKRQRRAVGCRRLAGFRSWGNSNVPDYTIRDPRTGRTVTLRGESPPSEVELEDVFAKLPPLPATTAPAAQAAPQRTWTDTAVDALPAVGGALGGIVGEIGGT